MGKLTRLNLITFASVFQKQEADAIRAAHVELFEALDADFDVNIILGNDIDSFLIGDRAGVTVVFIATGGTEGLVVSNYARLPHPLVLLTDGKANSLAASLELGCWTRQQGDDCRILHGDFQTIVSELKGMMIKTLLKGKRIGMLGVPSDWLVSSGVDYEAAKDRWGVEYVDISLDECNNYFAAVTSGEVSPDAKAFVAKAAGCVEPSMSEVVEAMRLYRAIKRICVEYRLDAVTVQCFNLIPTTHTTGCLALALLDDEGIVAGCEGDLQAIFTKLFVKKLTGVDTFMANPSRIDVAANQIILAHCTIGLKQVNSYVIRSHFESMSGVAIQGIIPEERITIVKCGGRNLDKVVALSGKIVENQDDSRKCRTQVLVQLDADSPVAYFLDRSIGNHHIIVQGDYAQAVKDFAHSTGLLKLV